MTLKFRTL